MRKRWLTVACLLTGMAWGAKAQENLVFNPSFEEHVTCPQRIDALGIMREVEAWWQPTAGSSDYFHPCGGRECSVPRNKMGQQVARTGEAYCGIYCSQGDYREYLQTELQQPLVKGRRYRVSFYVSLAEKSPEAVATLGALLTSERVGDSLSGILLDCEVRTFDGRSRQSIAVPFRPQVVNSRSNILMDTKNWMEISGDFVAEGGERFFTIGNFFASAQSQVVDLNNSSAVLPGAYYYVDDVSLTCIDTHTVVLNPADDTVVSAVVPAEKKVQVGQPVVLRNVYFDVSESTLLPQSYRELALLLSILEQNPTMRIEICGHTDNTGTIEFNQRLSENRAKAVVDYLVQHGIDRGRLQWKGFGKSQPVDTNETAEGRSNNRRVEYRILQP